MPRDSMTGLGRAVVLKDCTLREGLDTPSVTFSVAQKLRIAEVLAEVGVPEAEVVAPSRVLEDLEFVRELRSAGLPIETSGLLYANGSGWRLELDRACECLDRADLLMPLSERRKPGGRHEKIARLLDAVAHGRAREMRLGAGFPHATRTDAEFLLEIAGRAVEAGAERVTLYDTNGSAEPFRVCELVQRVTAEVSVPVFFHAHNDLGLAAANAWAAVAGGATGLDVTINGLGDRAGNASLEQVAMLLHVQGLRAGVELSALRAASRLVEALSGIPVSQLAPVVGGWVFEDRSPAHAECPAEFLAFDPALLSTRGRSAPSLP